MKQPINHALIALALFSAPHALAEDPTWFEVELLAFTHSNDSTEQWPENQTASATSDSLDLFKKVWMPDVSHYQLAVEGCNSEQWYVDPQGCEKIEQQTEALVPTHLPQQAVANDVGDPLSGKPYLLPKEMLQFVDQAKTIQRSGNKVLVHSAWQMPVYGKRSAEGFHIYGGKNYQADYQVDGSIKSDDTSTDPFAWLDTINQQSQLDKPIWELDGKVTIYLNRFLYIQPDLTLRKPATRELSVELTGVNEPANNTGVQLYSLDEQPTVAQVPTESYLANIVMDQSRRVRSREIHYFDHPEFGLVVQIRRMEQPEIIPEEPANEPTVTNQPD